MLAEITPQQFAEWVEADRMGLFDGGQWYQAGTIAATVHNEIEILAARFSKDAQPRILRPSDFVPHDMRPAEAEIEEQDSVQQFADRMNARWQS